MPRKAKVESISVIKALRMQIQKVGQFYGEDEDFLEEYIETQINAWKGELHMALRCFQTLLTSQQHILLEDRLKREAIERAPRSLGLGQRMQGIGLPPGAKSSIK